MKNLLKFLGPAFIVSVAYIDPGNFATNIKGGSLYGYSLLWVILWSNLAAIFLQTLSAKLGIATGANLPRVCGRVFSRRANVFFFIVAELAAMATDLAEFIGGALGLHLLFGIPMVYAGLLTVVLTFVIVYAGKYGQRVTELIISVMVGVISLAYALELWLVRPDWGAVAVGVALPQLPDGTALLIAAGMLGATVMPHVIYLHSELVQHRNGDTEPAARMRHFRFERADIIIAMNIAFVVNAAMVISAAVFHKNGLAIDTIEQAHKSLTPLLGAASSWAFGLALIASGLSSSAVGTMAGQTVMQGFLGLKINDNVTRFVTMLPGMLILLWGTNPMQALIISQVALSFALPAAVIPMLLITARRDLMRELVNKRVTTVTGWIIASMIVAMNAALLVLLAAGKAG